MSKISVVIPIYNVEGFLREALNSVVNQTFKDLEIICIDDCSTDNSLEIVKEFAAKDERIIVIEQKINQGEIVAKYLGAMKASGDYIGTLDPDDYLPQNYYETLYNEIVLNDADVAICDIKRITETGKILKRKQSNLTADKNLINFDETYINKINPGTPNKLIKKEIFLYAMSFSERDIWKDYYQYWKSYTKFLPTICFVKDTFYFYRKRNGSITRGKKSRQEKLNSLIKTIEMILCHLIAENLYEKFKNSFWEEAFFRIKNRSKSYFIFKKITENLKNVIKKYQIPDDDIKKYEIKNFIDYYFPTHLKP